MELDDSAFPLLTEVVCTDDADLAFGDADVALLVGAMPRKDGMDRADLLSANGGIFKPQGQALSRSAQEGRQDPRGRQPRQHQRLIAMNNAADLAAGTLHGDDPPRSQPGHRRSSPTKLGAAVNDGDEDDHLGQSLQHAVSRPVPLRGQRSSPPTKRSAITNGSSTSFIPTVAKRGAAIIEARGASSATSAANAALDHIRVVVAGNAGG